MSARCDPVKGPRRYGVVICFVATLNLFVDFEMMWLYLEILRLLSKLRS